MIRRKGPFVGNDVVDRKSPLLAARAGDTEAVRSDWRARHLTENERRSLSASPMFWQIFAAKEAASKALAQAGVAVTPGAFRDFEVDLRGRRVRHVPTDLRAEIGLMETSAEAIHAVVLFPSSGGAGQGVRLAAGVAERPEDADASEAARDLLASLLANASGGGSPGRFAVSSVDGCPTVLESGERRDWSVSLSHAGRFVAACAVLP